MEFAEIAIQKLLQLFPELSSYIVSFKDLTNETGKEESGLRVGMFIVQFGQDYFFLPIIAKGDTILPIDSLFSQTEEKFFPLTKAFIDKAITSSQIYLGKPDKIPPAKTTPDQPQPAQPPARSDQAPAQSLQQQSLPSTPARPAPHHETSPHRGQDHPPP